MPLRDIPVASMLVVSGAWLDPRKERALLARLARVAPFLPDLQAAHEGLIHCNDEQRTYSKELAALMAKTTVLDDRFDRFARGIYSLCTGLACVADDVAARRFEQLLAELMPEGLSIISQRYLVEAGQPELVENRLSPESRALLAQTHIDGVPLRAYVDEWEKAARALGEAESEKARVTSSKPPASLAKARNAWVRVVTLIMQVLDHEDGLGAAERNRLLQPLQKAEAQATSRPLAASTPATAATAAAIDAPTAAAGDSDG